MYGSYGEGTFCTPVMMRGPIGASYDKDLVYTSYDEGTLCMTVMMMGPCVHKL